MQSVLAGILLVIINILLEIIYIVSLPVLIPVLWHKHYLRAVFFHFDFPKGGILIHAASVGEVMAIQPLVLRLLRDDPSAIIYISTTTLTGLKVAKSIDPRVLGFLSPLDLWHLRLRQLREMQPALICIVETEIWFNLFHLAGKADVPILILNARMSGNTHRNLSFILPLLRLTTRSVKEIVSQSEGDTARFKSLFTCQVTGSGNIKYAVSLPDYDPKETRAELGYSESDMLIVWGSSRPGEELIARDLYQDLTHVFPHLKLIVAIRHPKRSAEVRQVFAGFEPTFESEESTPGKIHIIDVIGKLNMAYSICDLAIVGGSFTDFGGHNPLEPAYYNKAIVIGPYHSSCKASVKKLREAGGIVISDKDKLLDEVREILHSEAKRTALGASAKRVLNENSRSLDDHIAAIIRWIKA